MYAMLTNSLGQGLITAFMVLGVLITFELMGFPDMTVTGSYMLGGAISASIVAGGHNPIYAMAAGSVLGAAAGACTALMHTKMGINAIIAGLLTSAAAYSAALVIMGRPNVSLLGIRGFYDYVADALGLSVTSPWTRIGITGTLFALTAIVLFWFLNTDWGITVRAVGSNEAMIRALAVNTDRTKMLGVVLSNALVAGCGALTGQDQGFADVNMGVGALVVAFASLVIGQAIVHGRSLQMWIAATAVGSVLYRLLLNLALRTGLPPNYFQLLTAMLVLVALYTPFALGGWRTRRIWRWEARGRRRPGFGILDPPPNSSTDVTE